ncbi:MAG: hypothetical protein GY895_21510 [Phycisphaera sp.]|nr:hypothetical protein [Phycisphaera sp.]
MNHEHTDRNQSAPRTGRLALAGLVILVFLGSSMVDTAFGEGKRRKPEIPRLTSDIDNEGPLTRRPGDRLFLDQRDRRAALAGWRGVIRLDLILPIQTPDRSTGSRP